MASGCIKTALHICDFFGVDFMNIALIGFSSLMRQGMAGYAKKFERVSYTEHSTIDEYLNNGDVNSIEIVWLELLSPIHNIERIISDIIRITEEASSTKIVIFCRNKFLKSLNTLTFYEQISLISSQEDIDLFENCIQTTMQKEKIISPKIFNELNEYSSFSDTVNQKLTSGERLIFSKICAGMSYSDISLQLKKSPKTISAYKREIMRKLNISKDAQLFSLINRYF